MTNNDAIKWLENLKQDIGQLRHEDLWPYAQAIDEICGLLKEHEPLEPIRMHHTEHKQTDNYRCKFCGNDMYFEQTYCECCGKKVKWDE